MAEEGRGQGRPLRVLLRGVPLLSGSLLGSPGGLACALSSIASAPALQEGVGAAVGGPVRAPGGVLPEVYGQDGLGVLWLSQRGEGSVSPLGEEVKKGEVRVSDAQKFLEVDQEKMQPDKKIKTKKVKEVTREWEQLDKDRPLWEAQVGGRGLQGVCVVL